jgi:hypothetical protein
MAGGRKSGYLPKMWSGADEEREEEREEETEAANTRRERD